MSIKHEEHYWEDKTKVFLQGIDYEDLITIVEVARIALEQPLADIGHELDLSDDELNRVYNLIKIEEASDEHC